MTLPERPAPGRIAEIDILRGCAIAAVVGLHVSWSYLRPPELAFAGGRFVALLALLCGFGVPLFLALSAAGLALRSEDSEDFSETIAAMLRRIVKLLPAYLLWSIVSALAFRDDAFSSLRNTANILLRGQADGQFYFVPLLVELYVLWPLLRPLARFAARSGAAALAVTLPALAAMATWWHFGATGRVSGDVLHPMFWIGYFVLGLALLPHLGAVRAVASRSSVIVAALLATAASASFMFRHLMASVEPDYHPLAVTWSFVIFQAPPALYTLSMMTLLLFVACRSAGSAAARALSLLGSHSYGIFLVHLLLLRLCFHRFLPPDTLAGASLPLAAATVLGIWGGCLLLSAALVAALSRAAASRPLVSNRW